jgi:hypothetical protein
MNANVENGGNNVVPELIQNLGVYWFEFKYLYVLTKSNYI